MALETRFLALTALLPAGSVITDPAILESYRQDWSFDPNAGTPAAVVRPSDTAQVQAVLQFAAEHELAVVTRGAGTSVVGGSTAADNAITLSMERMTDVRVDAAARIAVVQAGAVTATVKSAAAAEGLFYPPDPSSFEMCSIGGNVATNAGGPCAAKYGITGDYVLAMTVVLADGSVVSLGGPRTKDSPGLPLMRLFIGSEGTLGVITEITLRLVPEPGPPHTLVAFFGTMGDAAAAVQQIASSIRPSQLELMDTAAINIAEDYLRMELDRGAGAMLIARSDAGAAAEHEIEVMEKVSRAYGATDVFSTGDKKEGDMFDRPREVLYEALEQFGVVIGDDVAVPLHRLAELTDGMAEISERYKTTIISYTHAADELTHPVIGFPAGDGEAAERAFAAQGEIQHLVATLGGTVPTEYGIGRAKRETLTGSLSSDLIALNRRVKEMLDPAGMLNPNVLIP